MFKKTSGIISILLLTTISSEVQAQTVENNVNSESTPNQEQTLDNRQDNDSSINQTSIFNLGSSATYKIQGLGGRNVVCPKPSLIVGSGYNFADGINFGDNSSYAVSASMIFPLGKKLGKTCKSLAKTIAQKTQYDLEISTASSCIELNQIGISLDAQKFPTIFKACNNILLAEDNNNLFAQEVNLRPQTLSSSEADRNQRKTNKLRPHNFRSRLDYLKETRR